jgi:hypothetical protein
MEPAGLDVVVCLLDASELPRLDHCLFSLVGHSFPSLSADAVSCGPLRLHLMLPRFSYGEVQSVRKATQALRPLDETVRLTVHNWDLPEPFDLRVPLMNWGLKVAKGRYFSCLRIGDLILPGAYARLLARLRVTKAAMALGGVLNQRVRWWGDVVLPLTAMSPGLLSIPNGPRNADLPTVFLLDRTRVPLDQLKFRVGSPDTEVDLVRRIAACCPIDTKYLADLLAVHQDVS